MYNNGLGTLQEKIFTLLNVVIAQSATILKLLSGKYQSLLVWRNSLFILDLGLDILDSIRRFHLQGNGLTRQSFDENLHGEVFSPASYIFKRKRKLSAVVVRKMHRVVYEGII